MKFSLKSFSFVTILSFPLFAFAAFDYTPLQPITIPGGGKLNDPNILKYLANIYTFAIAIAGGLAVIRIVWAGVKYMLSDVVTNKKDSIQEIKAAVYGLLMALGAFVFLETLNPNLVKFNLNISATNKISGDATGLYNSIPSTVSGGRAPTPGVNTAPKTPSKEIIGAAAGPEELPVSGGTPSGPADSLLPSLDKSPDPFLNSDTANPATGGTTNIKFDETTGLFTDQSGKPYDLKPGESYEPAEGGGYTVTGAVKKGSGNATPIDIHMTP